MPMKYVRQIFTYTDYNVGLILSTFYLIGAQNTIRIFTMILF